MNIPNKLTVVRIVLMPVFLLFLVPFSGWTPLDDFVLSNVGRAVALLVFVIASLTDLFDGMIARKLNLITTFGKFIDSIADKLLTISGFVAFAELGRISSFVVMIIIAREFLVTGIRLIAAERGNVISAGWFGKIKTVFQMITLIMLMIEPLAMGKGERGAEFMSYTGGLMTVNNILICVTVVLTIFSGINYFLKNKELLKKSVAGDFTVADQAVAGTETYKPQA